MQASDWSEAVKIPLRRGIIYGPAPANLDFWSRKIERISDRWPMHFHNAMTALARGLVEAERNLAAVDAPGILELAGRCREGSYANRADTDAMRDAFRLIARVMADLPDEGVDDDTMIGLIEDNAGEARGWRLPIDGRTGKPMEARVFLNHIMHQGVLIRSEDEKYTCPIPSFRSFLMERGGEPPPPSDEPDESADNDGGIGDGP